MGVPHESATWECHMRVLHGAAPKECHMGGGEGHKGAP